VVFLSPPYLQHIALSFSMDNFLGVKKKGQRAVKAYRTAKTTPSYIYIIPVIRAAARKIRPQKPKLSV